MEYRLFTPEMQAEHRNRQRLQAEADHYAHTLNAEAARAAGDDATAEQQEAFAAKAEAVAATVDALDVAERAKS